MPISASQIVQVNPRILASGASNLEFNGLLLTKNSVIPTGQVLNFADLTGVGEYFGLDSEEYSLATVYFLGYDNSFIKPKKLLFAKAIPASIQAFMRGGAVTDLASLQAIESGNLDITLDGVNENIEEIDLSSATSFSEVASIIQTALRAANTEKEAYTLATVTYSSTFKAFTITNGSLGSESTTAFPSGTVANALNLTEDLGAVLSQGSDALSYVSQMTAITNVDQNWVNFTTTWTCTEEDVLGYADWANSQGVDYLFIYGDSSPTLLQANSEATIAYAIKEANLSAVAGCYGNQEYPVFIMAIGASIDWTRVNSVITTAFKSQSGLPANDLTSTDALNLISQGMNFVGDYATRNDNFIFNYPGQMFGDYAWIDAYWGAVWLKNQVQAACMFGFNATGRAPYTERGYTLVRSWIQDPINSALNNGVIDVGLTLSETQIATINNEAGLDIATEVANTGYFLLVADPGASARVNRESPTIGLWYTYGGAINALNIPLTMLT